MVSLRKKQLFGKETPRIFTEPLRELNEQTSLGFAAITFAEQVCKIELYPWQKWLLIHALELHHNLTVDTIHKRGRLDPIFRFRKVVVLVARQNGKSTVSQVLALFFMYVLRTKLILGTAQDLDTAEEVWEGALEIIEDIPELAKLADKPIRVNGKKTIRLLNNENLGVSGERYKVKAASRRAGRGLSGDLIMLDELREHQTWDAWGAVTKTTMARPAAQIWAFSNAGDMSSIVLRFLRKQAHAALGDPDKINEGETAEDLLPKSDDELFEEIVADLDLDLGEEEEDLAGGLGIFEWSAVPECPVDDIDGILQANPSTGYGISLRTLLSDAHSDPEWVYRTECLCQWSEGTLEGPFPPGTWDAGRWKTTEPAPQIVGKVVAGVEMSQDRVKTYIAFAGRQESGRVQVELVAERAGSDWVAGWLNERKGIISAVTGQTRGTPASGLLKNLKLELDIPVEDWSGSDVPSWTGRLYDLVRNDEITHNPWPSLDLAAATAIPKLADGGAFMWDLKRSPHDVAPLQAATAAVGLLTAPTEQPKKSAYEERGVLSV